MSGLWAGERVRLRAFEPADVDVIVANDTDTDGASAAWRVVAPRSAWAAAEWVEQATKAATDGDEFQLGIEALEGGELVGTLKTHSCDPVAGMCSYGITVFPWARGRGYGSEAVVILLRYLFGERRYQKCTVGVYAFNERSIGMHVALGFREEGRVRRAYFSAGRHWDAVILGLTAEEYAERWPLG